MKVADSFVPPAGTHRLPEAMSCCASAEMVFGTGMARVICAVPSLSKRVYGSGGVDWHRPRIANAGTVSRDASDLLVMLSPPRNPPEQTGSGANHLRA